MWRMLIDYYYYSYFIIICLQRKTITTQLRGMNEDQTSERCDMVSSVWSIISLVCVLLCAQRNFLDWTLSPVASPHCLSSSFCEVLLCASWEKAAEAAACSRRRGTKQNRTRHRGGRNLTGGCMEEQNNERKCTYNPSCCVPRLIVNVGFWYSCYGNECFLSANRLFRGDRF